MDQPWIDIDGNTASPLLLIADHASNRVPPGVNLGIDARLLDLHIAVDIGVAALGRMLCERLDCPGILGNVSRLVVDLNRDASEAHVIPTASDGHVIPGNAIAHGEREARIDRYHRPYHDRLAAQIAIQRPRLLISLHSFTPQLETRPEEARPWQIGILYNEDDRAARIAIPALRAGGHAVGDQQPYSGKLLNATMNRHGEANGIAYLGIEMRQDLIATDAGQQRYAAILAEIAHYAVERLASDPAA